MLHNASNFQRGEDVVKQVRFFLQVAHKKDTDRNCDIILKGYVFTHEDLCPNAHCQIKQYKNSISQQSKSKKEKKKLFLFG